MTEDVSDMKSLGYEASAYLTFLYTFILPCNFVAAWAMPEYEDALFHF